MGFGSISSGSKQFVATFCPNFLFLAFQGRFVVRRLAKTDHSRLQVLAGVAWGRLQGYPRLHTVYVTTNALTARAPETSASVDNGEDL